MMSDRSLLLFQSLLLELGLLIFIVPLDCVLNLYPEPRWQNLVEYGCLISVSIYEGEMASLDLLSHLSECT